MADGLSIQLNGLAKLAGSRFEVTQIDRLGNNLIANSEHLVSCVEFIFRVAMAVIKAGFPVLTC